MLRNVIYRRVVVPVDKTDGETPTTIEVTEETNGHAVWLCDSERDLLLKYHQFTADHYTRESALEHAVDEVRKWAEKQS